MPEAAHSGENASANRLVSVSGTFCSGKTTLVSMLAASDPGIVTLEEGATFAKSAYPPFDWEKPDARAFLFWFQVVRERQQAHAPVLVSDTSRIEIAAHYRLYGLPMPDWSALPVARYDLALVCDYGTVPLVDNGIRDLDPDRRARLHDLVLTEARRLSREVHILTGTAEERLAHASRLVNRLALDG